MAYNAVPLVTTGDLWTASNHNTYVRDNFAAGVPDIFGAKGDLAVASQADVALALNAGSIGNYLIPDSSESSGLKWISGEASLTMTFGGRFFDPTTGLQPQAIFIPVDMTITGWWLRADVAGSIQVDLWVQAYDAAVGDPTNTDSITNSNEPALSSAYYATDATLSGWTVNLDAGDFIYFNLDSFTTLTWAALGLNVQRR